MKKRLILIPCAINILIIVALFLVVFSLFPLFPSRSGYTMTAEIRINNNSQIRVLMENRAIATDFPTDPASLLHEIEKTFGMQFQADFNIFICRNKQENARLCPFFVTPATGIAVSGLFVIINLESMRLQGYSLSAAIIHEATHVLFSQNTDLWNGAIFSYTRAWFREGTAVFMQQSYDVGRGEEAVFSGDVLSPSVDKNSKIFMDKNFNVQTDPPDRRREYMAAGAFCRHLIDAYGADAFNRYCLRVIQDMNADVALFMEFFGKDLAAEFAEFAQRQ